VITSTEFRLIRHYHTHQNVTNICSRNSKLENEQTGSNKGTGIFLIENIACLTCEDLMSQLQILY
jgi:hypothetical protein